MSNFEHKVVKKNFNIFSLKFNYISKSIKCKFSSYTISKIRQKIITPSRTRKTEGQGEQIFLGFDSMKGSGNLNFGLKKLFQLQLKIFSKILIIFGKKLKRTGPKIICPRVYSSSLRLWFYHNIRVLPSANKSSKTIKMRYFVALQFLLLFNSRIIKLVKWSWEISGAFYYAKIDKSKLPIIRILSVF